MTDPRLFNILVPWAFPTRFDHFHDYRGAGVAAQGSGQAIFIVMGRQMKFRRRQFLSLAASAAAMPAVSRMTRAQTYPTRPVCILVGPLVVPPWQAVDGLPAGVKTSNDAALSLALPSRSRASDRERQVILAREISVCSSATLVCPRCGQ